jgi:tetratricopeptide (TPR) repeat protein
MVTASPGAAPRRLLLATALAAALLAFPGAGAAAGADAGRCAAGIAEPGDMESRRNLAIGLTNAGRYDEFIAQFREIAARHPNDGGAQYDLAAALGYLRRYAEAVAPIKAALRLSPDAITMLQAATVIYAKADRFEDARTVTRHAAELGDAISMYDMHRFHRYGIGGLADPFRALEWLLRAANTGHLIAMDELVDVYTAGLLGQAPDDAASVAWAARARAARATD